MGSKKRRRPSARPSSNARASGGGPPWIVILGVLLAVGVIGVLLLPAADPEPTSLPTAEPRQAAAPAARVADTPVSDATTNLQSSPLPPLPLVDYTVPRPPRVIRAAYEFAARHPEVLRYIPCYCGCENSGHRANVDCFVQSRDGDGHVRSWDTHGMT